LSCILEGYVRGRGGGSVKIVLFIVPFFAEVLCLCFQLPVFPSCACPSLLNDCTIAHLLPSYHAAKLPCCQVTTFCSPFHFFCPEVLAHKHPAVANIGLSFNVTSAHSFVEHKLCATDMRCCLQLTFCGGCRLLLFNNTVLYFFLFSEFILFDNLRNFFPVLGI
jgi:hypothetical protein